MPKTPVISGRRAIQTLEKFGFKQVRQRGSHIVLRKAQPHGDLGCVVPLHKELALGTLQGILRQAKVPLEDFLDKLH